MSVAGVQSPAVRPKPRLMTGEDLFALPENGRSELIRGELVTMAPTGYSHGMIESTFAAILRHFVRKHGLGHVMVGEVGIYIQRDPDTIRAADVVYISHERLAQAQSPSYLDVAPELIVEILSPTDRWSEMLEKLEEYFIIGVTEVWLADPRRRDVLVYRSLTEVQRFTLDDTLSHSTALPDFAVNVAELFESLV